MYLPLQAGYGLGNVERLQSAAQRVDNAVASLASMTSRWKMCRRGPPRPPA